MKPEEQRKYKIEPDGFWAMSYFYGGYEMMEIANTHGWTPVAGWGKDGYDLGSWPYLIVFVNRRDNQHLIATYCEGDITQYQCPTDLIRNQIITEIAFYHWKHSEYSAPPNMEKYNSTEDLPDELKGPYRG